MLGLKEVRQFLKAINKDYKKFNNQIIDLDKKLSVSKEEINYTGNELRKRQYLSGFSIEDLELILHPMVEEEKEATEMESTKTEKHSVYTMRPQDAKRKCLTW